MVGKLVGDHLRVNAEAVIAAGNRRGQSTGFLTGRNLRDRLLAFAAGPLVTANLPNEQLSRLQVKAFTDIGANDRHLLTTARTHPLVGRDVRVDDLAS